MNIIEKKYVAVRSKESAKQMLDYIESNELLAYDVEATGLNPRKEKIIGFSVSANSGEGYYLPTKVYNVEQDHLEDLYIEGQLAEDLAKFLVGKLVGKKLCMHNGVYDCEITKNYYGVSLIESLYIETMLLVHTLAEEGAFGYGSPFALKSIAKWKQEEFKLDAETDANEEQLALKESIKKNRGTATKGNMEIYKADLDILCEYGASDTDLTIRIVEHFLPKLKEENLWDFFFEQEVMPVYRQLTYPLVTRGVRVDESLLESNREEISKDLDKYSHIVLESLMSTKYAKFWVVDKAVDKFPYKVWDEEKEEHKIKNKGKNAQEAINRYFSLKGGECPLPPHPKKEGQWHSIKSNVKKYLKDDHPELYAFLEDGDMEPLETLEENFFVQCSINLWKDSNDGYIKISSKKQLAEIVFDHMGEEPLSFTDKGSPQFNDDFVQHIKEKYKWAKDLYIFNRLSKIKSGYFDRIYDNLEEGRYYFNYKQHGTISGRYGSDAQQFPRPMEEGDDEPIVIKYSNEVRALFIPDEGHIFIDCDYESLEPHCVHEDSLVIKNRTYSRIKNVEVGDWVYSNNPNKPFVAITNKWKSTKKVLEIITKKGVLRCSGDHKVYTLNKGWTTAKEIIKGDILEENKMDSCISFVNEVPLYTKKPTSINDYPLGFIPLTPNWCWIIGALLGDGSFGKTSVELIGLKPDNNTTRFKEFFQSMGYNVNDYPDLRSEDLTRVRVHDAELKSIFKNSFNLVDSKGKKKLFVPDIIFNTDESNKLSFLAGLIDTDGTYNSSKSDLFISSKSASFLAEVLTLCNSLGLDPRLGVAHKRNSNGKVTHRVYQLRFTSISTNKLYDLGINDFLTTERKKIEGSRHIGKFKSPQAVVLEVVERGGATMYDIEVDSVEHDFICDNLRVHNCFSAVANDPDLMAIFKNGYDFYSTIAIATEKLEGVSADKKADNYLKKLDPNKRQRAKAYCLDGNTKVKTRDGTAKLKRIEVGDLVLTSSGYYNKVINTFKRRAKTCLLKTDISDIRCTLDHKFYVDGDWVEAKDLTIGCYFKSYYNSNKNPILNEIILDELEVDVYDITVENEHNFYANGILVHNCLGIPYGMGAYALSKSLEIKQKEAQSLIDQYLDAYPELKKWMKWSNEFAIKNGYIKNKVGRIRHLNNLKRVCDAFGNMAEQLLDYNFRKELSRKYPEEQVMSAYRDYKNGLNNAKNFQIQSLAASVVNRAGLGVMREFKKEGIDGYPVAQIHDQWIFGVPKEQKQRAFEIVQYVMENETDVGIPLKAPPEFAYNWRDGH